MKSISLSFIRRILNSHFLRNEDGSAIVEFVALALPLFIPLFLFLNQYGVISDSEANLRTLSREMSRAVVTSENDEVAFRVAEEVFQKGAGILGLQAQVRSGDISYKLICRERPCISPNNEVTVSIYSNSLERSIAAVEYVSPWA